jgi:hypothetical protein
MRTNQNLQTVNIPNFEGMDTRTRPTAMPLNRFREAVNVDMGNNGLALRRQGTVRIFAEGGHSGFYDPAVDYGLFVRADGQLMKMRSGVEPLEAIATVHPSMRMSYAVFNSEVYFANGINMGIVNDSGFRRWGMQAPPPPNVSAVSSGGLAPGRYLLRYVVEFQGGESGPSAPSEITLDSVGGIALSGIPTHPEMTRLSLYMTRANGTEYFRTDAISPVTLDAKGARLETLHMDRPWNWTLVAAFSRRLIGALGNNLYFTDPISPHLVHDGGWLSFPDKITMISPMTSGCYVGTANSLYWLAGDDPTTWVRRRIANVGVIPQTFCPWIPNNAFGGQGKAAVFWTREAYFSIGREGGEWARVGNLVPQFDKWVVTYGYKEGRGIRQLVSFLYRPDGGNGTATGHPLTHTEPVPGETQSFIYALSDADVFPLSEIDRFPIAPAG